MRLIDADALLRRMRMDPLFSIVEQYGVSGVIDAEPTVDAIPVEWINRWYDRNYMYADIEIGDLLNDWKEVQKEEIRS